ncbi:MAG: LAGLIDADG family homing endonuclease [Nanoarchaeota archaeon]
MGNINKKVAECVGLWLAEGSQHSQYEITFTNNCFELIEFFSSTMNIIFKNFNYNPRIYVYTRDGSKPEVLIKDHVIKYYIHKRATKPYYIFRIASVEMVKKWREIINNFLSRDIYFKYILRGFFAGEGNIHTGKKGVRVIRISQKERKEFIDNLLNHFNLNYNFTSSNRMYNISNKRNWDIFAKNNLADLHPLKKEKFWNAYRGYKQEHYDKLYLKNKLLTLFNSPINTKKLAKIMKRSQSRITETLVDLKKEGKIINYRVGSVDFWTNNSNIIIISKVKDAYLKFLKTPMKTSEFAKYFKVTWASSSKRLNELKRLNLVKFGDNGKWEKILTQKLVHVI